MLLRMVCNRIKPHFIHAWMSSIVKWEVLITQHLTVAYLQNTKSSLMYRDSNGIILRLSMPSVPLHWNQYMLLKDVKQSHPTQFRPCKWQAITGRDLIVTCLPSTTKPSPIYQDSTMESFLGYLSGLPKHSSTGSQECYTIASNSINFGGRKRNEKLRMEMFTTK